MSTIGWPHLLSDARTALLNGDCQVPRVLQLARPWRSAHKARLVKKLLCDMFGHVALCVQLWAWAWEWYHLRARNGKAEIIELFGAVAGSERCGGGDGRCAATHSATRCSFSSAEVHASTCKYMRAFRRQLGTTCRCHVHP